MPIPAGTLYDCKPFMHGLRDYGGAVTPDSANVRRIKDVFGSLSGVLVLPSQGFLRATSSAAVMPGMPWVPVPWWAGALFTGLRAIRQTVPVDDRCPCIQSLFRPARRLGTF